MNLRAVGRWGEIMPVGQCARRDVTVEYGARFMQVSVDVRDRRGDGARALTLDAGLPAGHLVHEAHVGAGVYVRVDLLAPHRWLNLSVDELDDTSAPLLGALVGERALRTLRAGHAPGLDIDVSAGAPWLRVAAVDARAPGRPLPRDH